MIRALHAPVGMTVDLGAMVADAAMAERYWLAIGCPPPRLDRLPLGLALTLRGGPLPDVELDADTVSFHAGHTLSVAQPFTAGRRYRARGRIAEIFEKSGRSGLLTVIARSAELLDEAGAVVVTIREQQIVRRRGTGATAPLVHPAPTAPPAAGPSADDALEIGALIAVEHRAAPDAALVGAYAAALGGGEPPFFSDAGAARQLGFADVIVPGPIQSALFEALLAGRLPAWELAELSLTFRVSLIAGEAIALLALVTEIDDRPRRLTLDLTLENSRGERAAVGTARLR